MNRPFLCALLGHKIGFHFRWFNYTDLYKKSPDIVAVYCKRCNKVLIPTADPITIWLDYSEECKENIRSRAEPYF